MDYLNEKIRGFYLSDIFAKILITEDVFIKEFSKNKGKTIICGDYLINENFINKNIFFSLFRKKHYFFGLKDVLWGKFLAKKISYSCGADIIRVKNNLRAFYLSSEKPFCTKVLVGGVRSKENMKNEIDARLRIDKLKIFNIPKILNIYLDANVPFFIEEFVKGKNVNAKENKDALEKTIEDLWKMYESNGIDFLKITDIVEKDLIDKLKKSIEEIGIDSKIIDVKRLLEKVSCLVEEKGLIPCSLCHGDFSLGNMIFSNNLIYVLDWEKSGRMPIVSDFIKIRKNVEGIDQNFEYHMKLIQEKYDFEILSFRKQFALKIIEKIISHGELRNYYKFLGRSWGRLKEDLIEDISQLNLLIN